MISFRRFITSSVMLVGLATIAVVWPSATQVAQASQLSWLSIPAGLPLFDPSEIVPGDTGSATFTVTNPQPFPVAFSLAITGLVNDDNGCIEPEREIGDTTCGAGGGELQSDLRLVLTATSPTDRSIVEGTLDEWAAQAVVDTYALSAHEQRTYRVAYDFPIGSSNVTQSDLVSFQFEMRLDQLLESVASEPPPPVILAATPPLPATGTNSDALATIGLGAVLVGTALYTMSVRRRRSE